MTKDLKIILLVSAGTALLLAVIFSVMRRAETAREERFDWQEISRLAGDKGAAEALAELDRRLAAHPNDALFHYYKARLYYEAGSAGEALAGADRAIKLGYAQEVSHLLKALVYGRLYGDYARQKNMASKALSYDPTYDEGYLVRAEAEYALGEYKACAGDAASFSSLSPRSSEGYEYSLLCLKSLGDQAGAEAAGLKLLELKPGSHPVLWRLGQLYAARGLHGRAIENFSEAIRLSGGRPQYYLDRAASCEAKGDFSCAAWDYASAMGWKEISDYASYYYLLGAGMYRAGELGHALAAADAALKKDPANSGFYELRGRILADSGKAAAAKKDFLKMSALSPSRSPEAAALIKKLTPKK